MAKRTIPSRDEQSRTPNARRTFLGRLAVLGAGASVTLPPLLSARDLRAAPALAHGERQGLIASLGVKLADARRAWRLLDQATLEKDFSIESTVPNFVDVIQAYEQRGVATRERLHPNIDVAYGGGSAERLDVFQAADKGAPILMYIHGGGWAKSSKANTSFMADHFVPAGAHFVSIDYPLAPDASLVEIVASVRRAYQWVSRNAGTFGGDPTRVVVVGNSAGGHLAASVATEAWERRLGEAALAPRAVVTLSGVFDMVPQSAVRHNRILKMNEDIARRVSPIDFIDDAGKTTRLIAAVGGRETPEFVRQTLIFHAAWIESGRSADLLFFNDEDHFSLIGKVADPQHPLSAAVDQALHSA